MSRKEEVLLEILEKIEATHANTIGIMADLEVVKEDLALNTKAIAQIGKQSGNLAVVLTDVAGQVSGPLDPYVLRF